MLLLMFVDFLFFFFYFFHFLQVWMYEYFGVGPQLLEDVDDVFRRFLHWMAKYRLSTPPKHSLQAWQIPQGCLIDTSGATVNFFLFKLICITTCINFFFFFFFVILPFVKISECCIFRVLLLELRFLLLATLVVLLLLSWRHIPIF